MPGRIVCWSWRHTHELAIFSSKCSSYWWAAEYSSRRAPYDWIKSLCSSRHSCRVLYSWCQFLDKDVFSLLSCISSHPFVLELRALSAPPIFGGRTSLDHINLLSSNLSPPTFTKVQIEILSPLTRYWSFWVYLLDHPLATAFEVGN